MSTEPLSDLRLPAFDEQEDDPLAGLPNLFDAAIVFAVALMVAMASAYRVPLAKLATQEGAIPEQDSRPVPVSRQGRFAGGNGERIGVAYRLDSGEIVYLPDPNTQAPR